MFTSVSELALQRAQMRRKMQEAKARKEQEEAQERELIAIGYQVPGEQVIEGTRESRKVLSSIFVLLSLSSTIKHLLQKSKASMRSIQVDLRQQVSSASSLHALTLCRKRKRTRQSPRAQKKSLRFLRPPVPPR